MDQIDKELLNSDVICIYSGLSLYDALSSWVEKKERMLLFIEEDESAFLRAKQLKLAQNPKVRLFYHQKTSSDLLREIAWEFLYLKMGYFTTSEAGKSFFEELSSFQTAAHVLASDWSDCGKKIVSNLMHNVHHLTSSLLGPSLKNACKAMPAVVCGAGPSLDKAIPHLKNLRDKALIFAGGTAITALSIKGVLPHLAASIDPDPPQMRFLQHSCFETPFFYQSRFSAELLSKVHAPCIWMPDSGNYPLEEWLARACGIRQIHFESGWTVGTFCLAVALHLGCDPIILTGMDFSSRGSDVYASKIRGEEHKVKEGSSYTKADWSMSIEWIRAFAALHKEQRWINTSEICTLDGIEHLSFEEAIARYLQKSSDIDGYLHQLFIQAAPAAGSIDTHAIVGELQQSFALSLTLCHELLALWQKHFPASPLQDPDYTLLETQLESEIAYRYFLSSLWQMWKAPIVRKEPHALARELHRLLFFKTTLDDLCKKITN